MGIGDELRPGEKPQPMPPKPNLLASFSFVCGLIALAGIALPFLLYSSFEATPILISLSDGIIAIRNLSVAGALLAGILALREIQKLGGAETGKIYAWAGILVGASWITFQLLVGVTFLLSEIIP
jgi:hypothetical protein